MMKYYKQIEDNYIISININGGGDEVNVDEYYNILSTIKNRPQAEGKGYKNKSDFVTVTNRSQGVFTDEFSGNQAVGNIV